MTVNDTTCPTPTAAANIAKGDVGTANGWGLWTIDDATGKTTLATYPARHLDGKPERLRGRSFRRNLCGSGALLLKMSA